MRRAAGALAFAMLLLPGCGGDDAGESAAPELLYNRALAALGAGELRAAEIAAEKAAARGGPEFAALRDFLLGNAAFARSVAASAQAAAPEAEPFAFDLAIAHAEAARRFWQRAALSRADWPEARRNVERVLLQLQDLRGRKEQAEKERKARARLPEPPPPQADPGPQDPLARGEEEGLAPLFEPQPLDRSADLVERLRERLARKENEKRALRQAARRERQAGVEKDW